jgi:hypothetical protein
VGSPICSTNFSDKEKFGGTKAAPHKTWCNSPISNSGRIKR